MRTLSRVAEVDSHWIQFRECIGECWHDPGLQYLAKGASDGMLVGMTPSVQLTPHQLHGVHGNPCEIQTCSEILRHK
jgi:hypothetical protein